MKLLVDQNLSHRLAERLSDLFPGSAHVVRLGLEVATDREIWEAARAAGFVLLTKDRDFEDAIAYPGPPPKVVIVTLLNCRVDDVETLLRSSFAAIVEFEQGTEREIVFG